MSEEEKYRPLLNHDQSSFDDELTDFLSKAGAAKVPMGKGKEQLWKEIEGKLGDGKGNSKLKPWIYVGIAAAISLIATFTILFQPVPDNFRLTTGIGEHISHELPDGSFAILNANSLLSYSGNWNRELELSGEAFFEVKKGEKFIVKTNSGNVEVLGTSFNVFARNGDLEVECKTGKVNVSIPGKSFSEDIFPGEMVSFKSDTVKKELRKPELIGRWKSGEFYFNNQPFEEVMAELKRQFKVHIDYEVTREIEFNGYFTNKNLDQALEMVCLPLGLKYEKTSASRVVISESE